MNVTCPCANPPGYSITCNDKQLAVCGTVAGKVVMGCFDPPPPTSAYLSDRQKTLELQNWALGEITGERRLPGQHVSADETRMLNSGFYRSPLTLEEVQFRMPREEEDIAPQAAEMAEG